MLVILKRFGALAQTYSVQGFEFIQRNRQLILATLFEKEKTSYDETIILLAQCFIVSLITLVSLHSSYYHETDPRVVTGPVPPTQSRVSLHHGHL